MNLEDVLLRGNRASQPLPTDVAQGSLYFVTDENIVEQSLAGSWVTYSSAGAGSGDVVGPVSSVDSEIVLFDGITGKLVKRATGSGFATVASGVLGIHALLINKGITIDGGGSVLTTGIKGDVSIPFAGTITKVRLLADQSGSIVIDIWKDSYANYPPTVADTITASAKPTISAAIKSEDATLTGWTTAIVAGDTLRFNVDSVTSITRVTLELTIQVTP